MALRRRAVLMSSALVLSLVGLTSVPASAATSITIEQGESIEIGISGVDRVTPAHITWGDGSASDIRTKCRTAKARRNPTACTAKGLHAYASAGTFTVSSTRKGRTKVIGTVIVTATEGSGSTPSATPTPSASSSVAWQQSMLDQVNQIRAAAGVAPLRMCAALERAAQSYSQTMADQKFFEHTGLDGSTAGSRARAAGYNWTAVGENIAYGQDTVTQVVTAWKNSPGHYANMVNAMFTDVGFGQASNSGNPNSPLWTQDFGTGGTC